MTRDPDETLAAIDDVIAWYGSDDAMEWTAEEPKRRYSRLAPIQDYAEAVERFSESLGLRRFVEQVNGMTAAGLVALPPPPQVRVDPEAARRAFEGVAAAMRETSEAMRPVAESIAHGFSAWARSPAVQQLIAFANSPEGRALIEAHQRGETELLRSCNCLCVGRHGDRMGICEGEAAGTRRYESPSVGVIDVAMCAPCLDAGVRPSPQRTMEV
ncbi:hypothetical protein [Sphaerisporangium sp. NPDC051011]|uniref:hypothetical protein n=1 Tax=Sphaerisporangium sp. NPDC051011 TaxID=3155792 RepID=UPI0034056FE6